MADLSAARLSHGNVTSLCRLPRILPNAMKLIVAGSTGFVGTELIRQALSNPTITSIAALARRPTTVPLNAGPGADSAKLKSVICEDFGNYPESVKQDLAGADACIWYYKHSPK